MLRFPCAVTFREIRMENAPEKHAESAPGASAGRRVAHAAQRVGFPAKQFPSGKSMRAEEGLFFLTAVQPLCRKIRADEGRAQRGRFFPTGSGENPHGQKRETRCSFAGRAGAHMLLAYPAALCHTEKLTAPCGADIQQ